MSEKLPPRANLEHLKNQAKALLRAGREGDPEAAARFQSLGAADAPRLADAQRLIAQQYGFATWAELKAHVESAPAVDPLEGAKRALHEDDPEGLRRLLAEHPELRAMVNAPVCAFDSPPIVQARSRPMLDVLLEAGADINARSRWWAGSFGILDVAEPELAAYAISRGAAVTVHAAARLGMMDRLRELLAGDPALVHARGGDGQMPLHFASTVEVADYLLDAGADIDARDIDHEATAAQWMVKDRREVAQHLVRRGCHTDILLAAAVGDEELVENHLAADPQSIRTSVSERWFPKKDPRAGGHIYIWTLGLNRMAHQVARNFGHHDVYRLLMKHSPPGLALAQACAAGDEQAARELLAADPALWKTLADVDRRQIVDTAQDNNTAGVRLMLSLGWPVGARGQHGGTALHWSAWHGNAQIVEELLRHGAALEDAENDFHATPLGWATHGSEHGWHRKTGDYAHTADILCHAGAKLPDRLSGTDAVKAVLAEYQRR